MKEETEVDEEEENNQHPPCDATPKMQQNLQRMIMKLTLPNNTEEEAAYLVTEQARG